MTPDDMRSRVRREADAASVALWEGISTGVASAEATLRGIARREDYGFLVPLLARVHTRNFWCDAGAPAGWTVAGNPKLMGQTVLRNDVQGMEMRLLKERRRTYPGGVPVAGWNRARRNSWTQPSLDIVVPAHPLLDEYVRLLLLWDRLVVDGASVLTVRVVHTQSPGIYGKHVPLDLNYEIRSTGGVFDNLSFSGSPEDEDLFADIERQENEDDDLAQ